MQVLHAAFLLIGTTTAVEMLTYRDILGALIAAIGHDIDHPGHSNSYEVCIFFYFPLEQFADLVLRVSGQQLLSACLDSQ